MLEKKDVAQLQEKIQHFADFQKESETYKLTEPKELAKEENLENEIEYTKMQLEANIDKIDYLRDSKSQILKRLRKLKMN